MRCRAAKFLSCTCPANTAVSSSSSSANSGTCFNTSGLQAIGHLFHANWIGSQSPKGLDSAQQATAALIVNMMKGAASRSIRQSWEMMGAAKTQQATADTSLDQLHLQVLSRSMSRQQRGHRSEEHTSELQSPDH